MTNYEELVEALRCKRDDCEGCDLAFFDKDEGWMCQYAAKDDDAADAIEALQAQLPKRGKWVDRYDEDDKPFFKRKYVCSACGGWNTYGKSKYCPNCGAKMNDSNASNALGNAQDGPIITPCRGCSDYDGYGGCKSKGGCARARMEVRK